MGAFISKKILDTLYKRLCWGEVLSPLWNEFCPRFKECPDTFPDYFRVAALHRGNWTDGGCRAIHLHYQRDNLAYPDWGSALVREGLLFQSLESPGRYKYQAPEAGQALYRECFESLI